MLDTTIHDIFSDLFYIVATAALPYAIVLIRKLIRIRLADSRGTMISLKIHMTQYHAQCMARGYVTRHGLQYFIEMYETYQQLGGNGLAERLLKDLKALPFREQSDYDIEDFNGW